MLLMYFKKNCLLTIKKQDYILFISLNLIELKIKCFFFHKTVYIAVSLIKFDFNFNFIKSLSIHAPLWLTASFGSI